MVVAAIHRHIKKIHKGMLFRCTLSVPLDQSFCVMSHHNIILFFSFQKTGLVLSKHRPSMLNVTTDAVVPPYSQEAYSKKPRLSAKLLRGQRSADDVWQGREAFGAVMDRAVDTLKLEGFSTFKAGSCFADLVETRTQNVSHYNPAYFVPEAAIVIPVLFDNDIDGSTYESTANNQPMMVNVRRNEGDGTTSGFPRKALDELWSKRRPGLIYIVPTRFKSVYEFKRVHLSYYHMKKVGVKKVFKTCPEKLANMLIAHGPNFPKMPLRKTHLREPYFIQFFGLTSGLTSQRCTQVFDLYLQKRTLTPDPLISIFGK